MRRVLANHVLLVTALLIHLTSPAHPATVHASDHTTPSPSATASSPSTTAHSLSATASSPAATAHSLSATASSPSATAHSLSAPSAWPPTADPSDSPGHSADVDAATATRPGPSADVTPGMPGRTVRLTIGCGGKASTPSTRTGRYGPGPDRRTDSTATPSDRLRYGVPGERGRNADGRPLTTAPRPNASRSQVMRC
ncbi:hypothetical protein ABT336_25680 [Micromonospora sp. NPDC000207]|uniref:hypothetical protein n=1 Tax=Micromonospora sp. NPDC000207 TaxID=3154246 RepID=UPI003331B90C